MSFSLFVCLFVSMCHRVQFFSRPLIGPDVTWPNPRPLIGQKKIWPRTFVSGGKKTFKRRHTRGDIHTDRHTDRRTSQLYDWIGPVGWFSENFNIFELLTPFNKFIFYWYNLVFVYWWKRKSQYFYIFSLSIFKVRLIRWANFQLMQRSLAISWGLFLVVQANKKHFSYDFEWPRPNFK